MLPLWELMVVGFMSAWFVNDLQVCVCVNIIVIFWGEDEGGGGGIKSSAWILYMWLTGLDLQA